LILPLVRSCYVSSYYIACTAEIKKFNRFLFKSTTSDIITMNVEFIFIFQYEDLINDTVLWSFSCFTYPVDSRDCLESRRLPKLGKWAVMYKCKAYWSCLLLGHVMYLLIWVIDVAFFYHISFFFLFVFHLVLKNKMITWLFQFVGNQTSDEMRMSGVQALHQFVQWFLKNIKTI
jgi:hypothetical protein